MLCDIIKVNKKYLKKVTVAGATGYIIDYAVGRKLENERPGAVQDRGNIYDEADQRADFGVGTVWSPASGGGIRPSSVLARNVSTFATGDLEMQILADGNKHVNVPCRHMIYALPEEESRNKTDAEIIEYVLAHQAYLFGPEKAARIPGYYAVHRDTMLPGQEIDAEGKRGNLHVHAVISSIDPLMNKALDFTGIKAKSAYACRQTELEFGLEHDHGHWIVDPLQNDAIRESTKEERRGWKDGKLGHKEAHRLARLEAKNQEQVEEHDGDFAHYANVQVEPKLRAVIKGAHDSGEPLLPIHLHNEAARKGCRLVVQTDEHGFTSLFLRKTSMFAFKSAQREELAQFMESIADKNEFVQRDELLQFRKDQTFRLALEQARVERSGELVPLSDSLSRAMKVVNGEELSSPRYHQALRNIISAEDQVGEVVAVDPGYITRRITRTESVFTGEDIDVAVSELISDDAIADLVSSYTLANDDEIVMLSPDHGYGVYTTKEILTIEDQFAADIQAMATEKVEHYSPTILAEVMLEVQTEKQAEQRIKWSTEKTPDNERRLFVWSHEQKLALQPIGEGAAAVFIRGLPGVGKTALMSVLKRYYDRLEAEMGAGKISGMTLAATAAERLENEAQFPAFNSALTLMHEEKGETRIHSRGCLVVDEVGMRHSRLMGGSTAIARERRTQLVMLGDPSQLEAIGAGNPAKTAISICKKAGTYRELTEIFRQEAKWHRDAVALMSAGIEELDDEKIKAAMNEFAKRNLFTWTDTQKEAVDAGAAWYIEKAQNHAGETNIIASPTIETTRHLNEAIQRGLGYGNGMTFETDKLGDVNLGVGERFIFLQNRSSKKESDQRVLNGDTGTVVALPVMIDGEKVGKEIHIRLDKDGRIVRVNPTEYKDWGLGYAYTDHATQGATVTNFLQLLGKGTNAEMQHVAASRARKEFRMIGSREKFPGETEQYITEVAANVADKGSTYDFAKIVNERGGPDTMLAKTRSVNEQRSGSQAVYERQNLEQMIVREAELKRIKSEQRATLRAINPNDRPALRKARAAHRAQVQEIMHAYGPVDRAGAVQRLDHAAETRRHEAVEKSISERLVTIEQRRVARVVTKVRSDQRKAAAEIVRTAAAKVHAPSLIPAPEVKPVVKADLSKAVRNERNLDRTRKGHSGFEDGR